MKGNELYSYDKRNEVKVFVLLNWIFDKRNHLGIVDDHNALNYIVCVPSFVNNMHS